MGKKVFIDGKAGTTGLRIYERLESRTDMELITLSDEKRKDAYARKEALNSADIVFLCLPDVAAKEAVSMIENADTVVIDTSTAHRTNPDWAYGFPELSAEAEEKISSSKKIAVPGCHASGFIALIFPLIESGLLFKDALLSCFSVTGYSGGGRQMIEQYESHDREVFLNAPRQYGITQMHKHLPEMKSVTGLETAPIFLPVVADFYSGMTVTIPIFSSMIKKPYSVSDVRRAYEKKYRGPIVGYVEKPDDNGFVAANKLAGKDNMEISVCGNEERILLISEYDNLGKGASGAALECMNIVLGTDRLTGLEI